MGRKKSLNDKALTRAQVVELIAAGGRLRPDLMPAFSETYATGETRQDLVYELPGDRFLFVFDPNDELYGSRRGKGAIYPADYFHRWVKWIWKVEEDYANGRASSVGHWYYYSSRKHELVAHIEDLVKQLASAMSRPLAALDRSYKSLDAVSAYVESIGVGRAQDEIYDHLVAYVGETMKERVSGEWRISDERLAAWSNCSKYPFVAAPQHAALMPINVVWEELSGLEPASLRRTAANEVRSARAKFL